MRAILGMIVYILIRTIGCRAIKKIESVKSVKSVMSFFCIGTRFELRPNRLKSAPPKVQSLVIPQLFVGYSLVIVLPNTYPKRIKTTKIPRLGRVGGIFIVKSQCTQLSRFTFALECENSRHRDACFSKVLVCLFKVQKRLVYFSGFC